MAKIKDAKDLQPIVEAKIKTMYGKEIENVKIKDVRQIDQLWVVRADCNDIKRKYTVRLDITLDGTVKEATETGRLWTK